MTRIYAVYERNRRLLVLFGMLFVAEIAGSLAVVDTGFPRKSILCLLMLYKAWTMYTNSQSSSLLGLIIRDRCVPTLNSSG
ncbi:hypothetical protein JB92DRAFT_2872733 [Gautieria morchelliformis]|nr:hypothetical protein JB92DRAFT_2872733 [Gautieria morchelliformis]